VLPYIGSRNGLQAHPSVSGVVPLRLMTIRPSPRGVASGRRILHNTQGKRPSPSRAALSYTAVVVRGGWTMTRKFLLVCGILSSLMYVLMDVVSGLRYEGYSFAAYTVSELSALGAPTR